MTKSETFPGNRSEKWLDDGGIPVREGMYFYLIIAFSLLIPLVLTICIFFTDILVTVVIGSFLASVLGFLICVYRKIKRQEKELDEAIVRLLADPGHHEIRMLGGLINVSIEGIPSSDRPLLLNGTSTEEENRDEEEQQDLPSVPLTRAR